MKRTSLTIGIFAAISPLLLIAAFVLANAKDAKLAWEASSYSGVRWPVDFVQSFRAAAARRSEARREIRAGHLGLNMGRMPMIDEYKEVLERRYGVKCDVIGGSVIDAPSSIAGWNAYNEEMTAEIWRRFGADALDKAWDEARRAAGPRL